MLLTGLTLIFVACKLMGIIDWSWLLCFCPVIVYMCFIFICFAAAFMENRIAHRRIEKIIEEKLKDDCK
ncbi:MAG: hypothetical protein LUD81_10120 [Clostridiales bacterium]|nr:hypothetical protein [Clostridiales bacterium]